MKHNLTLFNVLPLIVSSPLPIVSRREVGLTLRLLLWTFFGLAVGTHSARAEDFFTSKVEPLLRKRCYECHSHAGKINGGLALDSRSGWQTGGDSGPAVVPGSLEKSRLIEAVRYGNPDLEMPPKAKLPANEIALLEE